MYAYTYDDIKDKFVEYVIDNINERNVKNFLNVTAFKNEEYNFYVSKDSVYKSITSFKTNNKLFKICYEKLQNELAASGIGSFLMYDKKENHYIFSYGYDMKIEDLLTHINYDSSSLFKGEIYIFSGIYSGMEKIFPTCVKLENDDDEVAYYLKYPPSGLYSMTQDGGYKRTNLSQYLIKR